MHTTADSHASKLALANSDTYMLGKKTRLLLPTPRGSDAPLTLDRHTDTTGIATHYAGQIKNAATHSVHSR